MQIALDNLFHSEQNKYKFVSISNVSDEKNDLLLQQSNEVIL
jgi:hypothetical protein